MIEGVPPPPYQMIAHFQFASPEALKAALANLRIEEVRADIAKFTDITQTEMLGRTE